MGEPSPRQVVDVLADARAKRRAASAEFLGQADALTQACRAMADRFRAGGRLLVAGSGLSEADARHVAVEFVHPVIVGKRALPALAVADLAALRVLARADDIVMTITTEASDPVASNAMHVGAESGALTVALLGGPGVAAGEAKYLVRAPAPDRCIARELQVTAYHILWELVHVFLEGSARVDAGNRSACPACADEAITAMVVEMLPDAMARVETPGGHEEISVALVDVEVGDRVLVHAAEAIGIAAPSVDDPGGLAPLYPFLYGNEARGEDLDLQVRDSTEQKIGEIGVLREHVLDGNAGALIACATSMARAFADGGTLFAFGNGGSSTDALALCRLFTSADDRGLPAVSLPDDAATVTALANDVSFDVVYARQLAALTRNHDMAFGISTSGGSENVNRALRDARARGLETIGLAGSDGGNMMDVGCDHLFVVDSSSVHRVQEAQTSVYNVLWQLTHAALR